MNKDKVFKYLYIISITIFVIMFLGVQCGFLIQNDLFIEKIVKNLRTNNLTMFMTVITEIGGIIGITVISILVMIIFKLKKKTKEVVLIGFNVLLSLASFGVIKNIVKRARPDELERLASDAGYSFPSGHSTMNMALYLLLIYFTCKYLKNNKLIRNILIVVFLIMPILVGFSRIYLGMHYKTDVVAGFCLGIVCTITSIKVIDKTMN